jgi:hypothetical protein
MSLLHRDSTETKRDNSPTDVMASSASTTNHATDFHTQGVEEYDAWSGASITIRARGVGAGAFLALLISAWAAIVPFVGPTFGFSADGTSSWTWNETHGLGALLPGAIGVVACLMLLASLGRPSVGGSSWAFWGFILFLCGAWLTVVPVVWPVLHSGYFQTASTGRTLEYWLAYASGPGVLLAAFGAFTMGRAQRRATVQAL